MTHASSIHGPGINVVRVGAHQYVMKCLVYGECKVWVSIEQVEIVFVIVGGPIQTSKAAELDFNDGVKTVEQITTFKIAAGLPQTKGGTKLRNLKDAIPRERRQTHFTAPHAMGLTNTMTKPTYSSSPIPGGTSNWRGEVIMSFGGASPKRRHPDQLGHSRV